MGKGGRCVGLQSYQIHVSIFLKFVSQSYLEPSGPAKACNGIALPLPLPII
jgi:hypothetical protein